MARQQIDYKNVAKAAEQVKKQGKEPSLTNVCEELGLITPTPNLPSLLEKWYHNQPEFRRSIDAPLSENINIKNHDIIEKNVELEKSLSLLRATLESTADGIMMVNGKGKVVDWNQKFVEMWRIPSHMLETGTESIGFEYILKQVNNPEEVIADVTYLYEHPDWQGKLSLLHFKDGRIFERYTQPQRVGSEIVGRVYSFRDITQRLIEEDELRIRERAIEASTHGIVIINITKSNMPLIYVNKAFEQITGYKEKQIIGKSLSFLYGNKTENANQSRIHLAIKEFREETVELEIYRRSGETFWAEVSVAPVRDSFDNVKHYVCIINDITERRKMEQQLIQQATHDYLTELPNRVLLIDRVNQGILQAKKKGFFLAFLFLDLDYFKMINDTLGHSVGDRLLQELSHRLRIAINDLDTLCRLGGDEFVILLQDIDTEQQAQEKAKEILKSIAKPFRIDHHVLKITGSIGISYYPKDGKDYETLMKSADLAMYHAKDHGRNNYRCFEQEMNNRVLNRMQIDNALRDSLKRKEFYLEYQPLIKLADNKIVGFEALLRWHNSTLGKISPNDFIGIAEENNLIIDIGIWVLKEACNQLVIWHNQGYDHLTVAVNLSGRQFRQARLSEMIEKTVLETGLAPEFLELELTESLLVDNVVYAVETMYKLKDMGAKIVIDDFGTGYSSLSYLKQFPADKLKIDQSFISEVGHKENDALITKAIINLGHSLNLEVLAEGIENNLQREFLLEHGCDYAQGYYFSIPKKADELSDFLIQYTP